MPEYNKKGTIGVAFHYNEAKNEYSSLKLSLTDDGKVFVNMAKGVKGAGADASKVSMVFNAAEVAYAEAAFAEVKRRLTSRKIDSETEE